MKNTDKFIVAEEFFKISSYFIEQEMPVEAFNTAIERIRRASHRGFLRVDLTVGEIPAIRSAPRDCQDSAFNKLAYSLNLKGFKTAFKTGGRGLIRERVMRISWDMRGGAE